MVAHLGVFQVQVGSPTWDVSTYTVFWSYVLEQLLSDNELGWTNIGQLVTRAIMYSLNNPVWQELSDPSHFQQAIDVEGLHTVECAFPVGVEITIKRFPDHLGDWYNNPAMRKFGMVRRKNQGFYGEPHWINSEQFSASLGLAKGDAVEVICLPGIVYDISVAPWFGLPPCIFSDGAGVYVYNNKWYFSAFATL